MRNIPALLDLTQETDVVIGCGDDYPLDGYFAFPEPWRVQADTLSGVKIPDSKRTVSEDHAVEVIHNVLTKEDEPVTLLATGSLTNIAQWLTKYPQDKNKVSKLVIMGGAFDAPGNIIVPGFTDNHPNTQAEWNIYVDALAADIVVKSGLEIEMVGLDVTNEVKVTTEFAKDFKKRAKTPAAKFWDDVLDDNDWFIDSGEYYFWDVLAALVVIDPEFCQGEMSSITVQYDLADKPTEWAHSFPTTTTDGQPRKHYDPKTFGVLTASGDNPPAKICRKTDAAKAFELFTTTMNNPL
jgi:pyrimidine-specific ribonucleoside hydrolase